VFHTVFAGRRQVTFRLCRPGSPPRQGFTANRKRPKASNSRLRPGLRMEAKTGRMRAGFPGNREKLNRIIMGTIQTKVNEPVSDELSLVQAAKKGDVSAFGELVKRYDRNVFRIALHITQNREDAEDVVQDAFLKAYENLEQFQGQSKFYTWLVRIAVNEALMKLRRRRPERMVSLDQEVQTEEDSMPREVADWSPNPEQLYNQSELRDILGKTIQGLPPSFRTVFVLRDVEGLSTEETAQALELSVPAVKSRLLRARLQLRERLNRYFKKRQAGDGKQ